MPIPPGGAVLIARGSAAAALNAEAMVGSTVTTTLIFKPDWPGVVAAIGGGPADRSRRLARVSRGRGLYVEPTLAARPAHRRRPARRRAHPARHRGRPAAGLLGRHDQLRARPDARAPRCRHGHGSRRGRLDLDGVRRLVAEPAVRGLERPVSTALMFLYSGVYVQPAVPVVSPDGDGVADLQTLRYKLVKASTVELTLTAPDGTVAYSATTALQPGSYDVPFPPPATPSTQPATPAAAASRRGRRWSLHRDAGSCRWPRPTRSASSPR